MDYYYALLNNLLRPEGFTYLEDQNVAAEDVWVHFGGVTSTMGYNFCSRTLAIFGTSSQASLNRKYRV